MPRRPSTIFIATILALAAVLAALLSAHPEEKLQQKRAFVRSLDLTELCLFTEAGYTRHLATTDLATPFQDSPVSVEHFPSGALVLPPAFR